MLPVLLVLASGMLGYAGLLGGEAQPDYVLRRRLNMAHGLRGHCGGSGHLLMSMLSSIPIWVAAAGGTGGIGSRDGSLP